MFDAILVMKMDTLQEIVLSRKKRHHAHVSEDDEPTKKRFKREKDHLDEYYVLISALTGNISHGSNDWLVDSGASKRKTR